MVPALDGPSTFTLTITEIADCSQAKISLSQLWFYDADGQVITYDTISVVDENSPGNERSKNLYDQNVVSKWLDFGMDCTTGKFLQGSLPSYPVSYHFSTANDSPERDPISWALQVCSTLGICVDAVATKVTPPSGRRAHYPMELIGATWDPTSRPSVSPTETPETMSPTSAPTLSPTEAPAKAFDITFKFYSVRECEPEGLLSLAEIFFYDANQNKISWNTVEVVDGNSPGRERPKNLYDEDTGSKWLDRAFECSTNNPMVLHAQILEIEPVGYTFVTTNDFPERDPVTWDVTICVDGGCVTDSVVDATLPTDRFAEYEYFSFVPIVITTTPTELPTEEPCPDCCEEVPPTCEFGEAQRIDTILGSRPECRCCDYACPEEPECPQCCANAPTCQFGEAILGTTEPDENGCTCCDWTCPDLPTPSLDVVCGCVSQYNICPNECSVYTNAVLSSDTVCFDAFLSLVCEEGVENSFWGTPYYLYCPTQCPLNCEQYTDLEESLGCLKKHIKVLEYEVNTLQSNAGVEKEEAMAYCDTVKDEVNEIVSTGNCSSD